MSDSPHLDELIAGRLQRRDVLRSGVGSALAAMLGGLGLGGCERPETGTGAGTGDASAPTLEFAPVGKSLADTVTIDSQRYTASVLLALGDPIFSGVPEYANDGSEADFLQRAGDHHDGMSWFGLRADGSGRDAAASDRGLLVMNHENMTQEFLHARAATNPRPGSGRRPAAEVAKEISAHGVSVVEVQRTQGGVAVNRDSPFSRRITPETPMELRGPVRGHALVKTLHHPDGTGALGTLNNCANGATPWGSYLTCEENWAGYFALAPGQFAARGPKTAAGLARYGFKEGHEGWYRWATAPGDRFARWHISQTGDSADGSDDHRNEANTFGYVVEIDPFDPASVPRKRTALGRFAHECAATGKLAPGEPLVLYMGDDARNEYVYKFVSATPWDPADASSSGLSAGDKYLDEGTLYVARFDADGIGEWLPLTIDNPAIAEAPGFAFADQADVLVHTRLAADAVGATRMDRPEWCAVHPTTGDVYVTLTNSSRRSPESVDPANPRSYTDRRGLQGNVNGHILRIADDDGEATTFRWDVYLFGSEAAAGDAVNLSGLTDDNDFSSPDGIAFGYGGVLWIQTDDGAYRDITNCMMLAALPGRVGDGGPHEVTSFGRTISTQKGRNPTGDDLRRFLVGPRGCEITGIAQTPDGRTQFVNIQHPGQGGTRAPDLSRPETFDSHWPDGGSARPRSATIAITRKDGGTVGV